MTKPDYILPSMDEIEAVPKTGFTAASTFSGAGGSCLGYRWAGFNVLWASEFIPAAAEVYKLNHPNSILDTRDIRQVKASDILNQMQLKQGELDLLDGSPPCASFSSSGTTSASWGLVKQYSDTTQRVDDLFFEYARIITGIQPKIFVAENVKGLITGKSKGYFKEILHALQACGYRVETRLLDAQWLGVPQRRQRLYFMGVRNDLDATPCFPQPLSYRYTVRDVLPTVDRVRLAGRLNNWSHSNVPSPTIAQSDGTRGLTAYLSGGGWIEDASGCRKFTIEELRQICGFPADFKLTGNQRKQWERLGRAVPPPMSRAIGECVRSVLETL